ncbi:sulfotransferase family 2 domain-containing protein [Sulfitobacter geojensis]|uniref:Sulfotransferase family 2 domain-containing protein n=1 Tax=Sulfitobacter geojensis TaxID=1342299 RepID=A0AAE2VZW7_9RHOB|nr:sulfotransferase family 2 domain-containing protein [Sulfitobacter geojensis]MBM1690148.1 sulfotransferase family 2 domain-containing protein [Sulfitobacter geojensis]MBM1694214.1 sulfotransferase family 2 domain-containing protein [Sulfitobacter geojensis]MBM1706380.1 sulfotransferase family 2 domain-containing protein [Sulfitobacter geojensis]MBM1710438.1 sulfotransferase family 2 domain-containing protein [Sulfitobacter geojensis]MBM1714504.1 sulfotransferase family 2 domain-containing p
MIISRGRSYIFVHIPKTGGTSLALALENRAMKDDIMLGDTPKAVKRRRKVKGIKTSGRLWKHAGLSDIDGLVSVEEIAQMFIFTLVRNPWDRLVSYYHWLREQGFDHPAVSLAKAQTFEGFLADPATQAAQRAWPAARYMRDVNGVERASSYIRLEHFEQDAAALREHLGFELALPWENRSTRARAYGDYYSREMRETVAECCAEDIARFGYRFDPSL